VPLAGHGLRPTVLRRRTSRPQLKRDPLGRDGRYAHMNVPPFGVTACCIVALVLGVTACIPLPIPHNEQVTPPVSGTLRSSAGSSIAGAAIALTGSRRDTLCAHAAIRRVADEHGRFHTPATEARKTIFWVTMMEHFGPRFTSYWLCAGTVDSTGAAVYRARAALTAQESGDSLACLAWVWRERYWVACNGTSVRRIFEGGHWVQGSVQGRYRLIVADDEASGSSRAFVQWLEAKGRDAADSLAAAVELPEEVTRSEVPHFPFAERGGHWYLRVPTPKRTFWRGPYTQWLSFELGVPGDARKVPEP